MAKRFDSPLSHSSILFATFSVWRGNKRLPINGNLDQLRDFLVPRIKKLVIIDQPHPGSDEVMPKIEAYSHGSLEFTTHKSSWYMYCLKPILTLCNKSGTRISFKIRDFLSVLDWGFCDKTTFDYFIGLESINALAGILLRKLGKVERVIYYVSDYSPNRYSNPIFNWVYLSLDRLSAMHSDYIWDVSLAMQPARVSAGLNPQKSAPVIHVPNGLYKEQIKANPISKINKYDLVYMGTLGPENGPDIAIRALALVREKFSQATLHIVGGAEKDVIGLKKLIKKLRVKRSVIFHGFIPKAGDMSKIIASCSIGLAPYRNFFGSPRLYADAGKIRAYCASGLPTVSSQVPPLGREVEEKGAAIVVDDDPQSFAEAICTLLSDPKLYKKLRNNAIKVAKHNTWDNSFLYAFKKMAEKGSTRT